jgi:hypothetical protein
MVIVAGNNRKSSCDVDPNWIKKDGCETAAITLFAAFSQGEVFSFVLKPGQFSSKKKKQCVIATFVK